MNMKKPAVVRLVNSLHTEKEEEDIVKGMINRSLYVEKLEQ